MKTITTYEEALEEQARRKEISDRAKRRDVWHAHAIEKRILQHFIRVPSQHHKIDEPELDRITDLKIWKH